VWYEIRTAVNRQEALFQSKQVLALFAQVLGETAERFVFELRGLNLENERLVFYITPKDGFKLPQIMQWLKQTFCVRYNFLHGLKGHTWGDRYWSAILEGEPPPKAEPWTGPVMGIEASEFSPEKAREEACSGEAADKGRPRSGKNEDGVCPVLRKPAETPRKSAAPSG
jgi:REP element-mobilizing transposase RayT